MTAVAYKKHGPRHDGARTGQPTRLDRKGGAISLAACERAIAAEAETAAALWAKRMGDNRWDNRALILARSTADEITTSNMTQVCSGIANRDARQAAQRAT